MTTYERLYALASPVLKSYRDDLEKHDREAIEENPSVPFLHWTRESGTYISFLPPADTYPAKDVYVPYVFGTAEREHLLREKVSMAEFCVNPCYSNAKLVLYFDGLHFQKITAEKAVEISKEYRKHIQAEWSKPRGFAGTHELTGSLIYA